MSTTASNIMPAHSIPLPLTQLVIRRSFKSDEEDNKNESNCDVRELVAEGVSGSYKVRSEEELAEVERLGLHTLDDNPTAQNLFTVDWAPLFRGPKHQLETWPYFFRSKEESGIELQNGLVLLWSNFLIAETLLAAISIQPLLTVPSTAQGWQLKLYGYTWMISMMSDVWGIAITALFLGFLLACPNKVAWKWMCTIGWLRNIPFVLVLIDTMLTSAAIAYSCWILYGYLLGIICAMVALFFVGSGVKLASVLDKAKQKVTSKNM